MPINLNGIPIAAATPSLLEFGGILTPGLGGPTQKIERLGTRWSWAFETAPMRYSVLGQYWSGMLTQATREGGLLKVSQPGFDTGNPGGPYVNGAVAAGRLLPVNGINAGYQVRRGQWLSIVVDGRRYLYQNQNDVVSGGGPMTLTLQHMLRTPVPNGAEIELLTPQIEGWVTGATSWELGRDRLVGFNFTISEAE